MPPCHLLTPTKTAYETKNRSLSDKSGDEEKADVVVLLFCDGNRQPETRLVCRYSAWRSFGTRVVKFGL